MLRRALFGRHQPPRQQQAFDAINRGVLSSMMEDPAKRLAQPTGRRTYTGGELVVQSFLRPPAGPNDAASLEMAPIAVNARRSINNTRGRLQDLG